MNLPAQNLLLTPTLNTSPGEAGVNLPGILGNAQATDSKGFFEILASQEVIAPVLDRLKELLPEETFQRIEQLFESGNPLPDSADLAALVRDEIRAVLNLAEGEPVLPALLGTGSEESEVLQQLSDLLPQLPQPGKPEQVSESPHPLSVLGQIILQLSRRDDQQVASVETDTIELPLPGAETSELPVETPAAVQGADVQGIAPGLAAQQSAIIEQNQRPKPHGNAPVNAAQASVNKTQNPGHQVFAGASQGADVPAPRAAAAAADVVEAAQQKEMPFQKQVLGAMVRELAQERGNPAFTRLTLGGAEASSVANNGNGQVGVGVYVQATFESVLMRPTAPTVPAMNLPLDSGNWGSSLGDRIFWMIGQNLQQAKLKINPPNLGPLEIRVSVQNEQASVSFNAQHAAVKDAIEVAIPRLREMFGENSLQLVNVDVSHRDTGGQRALADQQFQQQGFSGEESDATEQDETAVDLAAQSAHISGESSGMVDYYA
jgi:flagellar hook-length control protein FliK